MSTKSRTTVVVAITLFGAACATGPLIAQGPAPALWSGYQGEAEAGIARGLRDPASAVFSDWSTPRKMVCHGMMVGSPVPLEMWVAEVQVNARNGFGGYVGAQPYTVLFSAPLTGGVNMNFFRMRATDLGASCISSDTPAPALSKGE